MGFFKKKKYVVYPRKSTGIVTSSSYYCKVCHYKFGFSRESTDLKDIMAYLWGGGYICIDCYPGLVEILLEEEKKLIASGFKVETVDKP